MVSESKLPKRPLSEVARSASGNSTLIKGRLKNKFEEGLYPAFSASGQDVFHDTFTHEGRAVILSAVGARCGKCFLASGKWSAIANTHIIWPNESLVDFHYLYFLLNDESFWVRGGSAQPFVKVKASLAQDVPVPPLEEQRRIVARIQECLSRVEEMERLQAEVAEDADAFYGLSVSRVIEELREKFPSKSVGDLVSGDKKAMRSGPFGSAMKHDEFVPDGNLVIGIANVQANRFNPVRKWMITDEKYEEMARYEVAPGDILITIMGTIGRTCVVPEDIGKAITSKHVYRIRFPKDKVVPEYVSFLINFDYGTKRQLFGSAAGGVMPGLNATKLQNLEICLPPIDVQQETVERLSRAHGAIREMQELDSRSELSVLRNAILRQAFAGEL